MERVVALEPFSSMSNQFLNTVSDVLRSKGAKVVGCNDPQLYSRTNAQRYVLLNWYDEVRGASPQAVREEYVRRETRVAGFLQAGIHVVTVIHNRVPHDHPDSSVLEASLRFRRLLCEKSEAIVGLCEATKEVLWRDLGEKAPSILDEKLFIMPHPIYECYKERAHTQNTSYDIRTNRFTYLFLGQLRPYKNIELILEVARAFLGEGIEAEFVIAGSCPANYRQLLQSSAPSNVRFLFGFVPDEEIVPLVSSADALILPYDLGSSLNSGTCILAFSLRRTVVCPMIGTLQAVPKDLVYSYSYALGDQESHLRALTASARMAYDDMRRDPLAFANKGRELYWRVSQANSLRVVGDALQRIFDTIESKNSEIWLT